MLSKNRVYEFCKKTTDSNLNKAVQNLLSGGTVRQVTQKDQTLTLAFQNVTPKQCE